LKNFSSFATSAVAATCVASALSGLNVDVAVARELYNHDTKKAAVPLTEAHQRCNEDVFDGSILRETIVSRLRGTADQRSNADERIFNCLRSYGDSAAAVMMIIPVSRTDPQACKIYRYSVFPGQDAGTHTIRRDVLDCTSSRTDSPYGVDPLGAFNLDEIWPAHGWPGKGKALPQFLAATRPELVNGTAKDQERLRVEPFYRFFGEFARKGNVGRGIHVLPDMNANKGSIGCIRLNEAHGKSFIGGFESLRTAWGPSLPVGFYRKTPIFFVDHQLTEKLEAGGAVSPMAVEQFKNGHSR
jgi:hypothetical protein